MAKNRSMVKLIHADDFFPAQDVVNLRELVKDFEFVQKEYGYELPNFNLIFPDIESILYHVLGERVTVDPERSGVIRKPFNNAIHFETFDSPNEWVFIVALEPTEINLWHHISDHTMGDLSPADSKSVFEGAKFNYRNLFEWKIQTNILLEPNQGLFIRPWMFHSLAEGMVQYYRLIADDKYRILVMGHPSSSKNEVTKKLSQYFENCSIINSMEERVKVKDIDFSIDGQMRHCYRLLKYARASTTPVTIINMACPLPKMREVLNPDFLVWVSDKTEGEYLELNEIYTPPAVYDAECKSANDDEIKQIIARIMTKRI